MRSGACARRPKDRDLFYPAGENSEEYERARAICDGCPVKAECLGFALDTGERYGMWGGMTPMERRTEARRRRIRRRARRADEMFDRSALADMLAQAKAGGMIL